MRSAYRFDFKQQIVDRELFVRALAATLTSDLCLSVCLSVSVSTGSSGWKWAPAY